MTIRRMLALAVSLSLVLAASAAPALAQHEVSEFAEPPAATPNPAPLEAPAGDGTGVRLSTELGDIVIGLFNESAPVAAENFANLTAAGFYDGIGFHRVAPGFVIQAGDPSGDGTGGPGYTISDEEVVGTYGRGIVAMARTQEPDSQGSQFFIVLDDDAEVALDTFRTYTIFGRVIEGMDVVDAIAERGPAADVSEDPVIIESATIEQVELPTQPIKTESLPSEAEVNAAELEGLIPEEVLGVMLERVSFTGDDLRAGAVEGDPIEELEALAAANGATLSDLAVASGSHTDGGSFVGIMAARLSGVPASDIVDALSPLLLEADEDHETSAEVIAGRDVLRVAPGSGVTGEDPVYVIPSDEIVWYVVADPEGVEEVIAALP